MRKILILMLVAVGMLSAFRGPAEEGLGDGEYRFRLLTTNDVHGRYFDSLYVGGGTANALTNVSFYVDSLRLVEGRENVILLDAGDCLQGDNAAYYSNYVDTTSKHIFARMVEYMGYDAVAVGNHDIETGHPVYDRIVRTMDVPFLAANAIRTDDAEPYFREYVTLKRHGFNITIIGFTNPNIKNWLSPKLWEGMDFESLIPMAQETVDRISAKEKSDIVIVAAHTGTGNGDGSQYENQGLDLYKSLRGVDFVVCAHDHKPVTYQNDSICLINSGSHCRNLGSGTVTLKVEGGKVISKSLEAGLVPIDKSRADRKMQELFREDFGKVRALTLKEVGELETELRTRDAYRGMSDYLNLIHTLSLSCTPAQISFAAPLTFDGTVKAGTILYNDLFTIYPFENQLFVVKMTGAEIKNYLEYSYDTWINTIASADERLLKIVNRPDPRTGQKRWSFVNRAYNFDSAGGLIYDVDVTKPYGQRVIIRSMADGSIFDETGDYDVAMTSYRASGGGGIMRKGAGIDTERIGERVVAYYPEIRQILYDYLVANGGVYPEKIGNPAVIGRWSFIPENLSEKALDTDMNLLFSPIVKEQRFLDSKYDSLKISTVIVRPEGEAKAVLQVSHGICGSKERFMPFMEFMASRGVACIANDHRGHGESVKSDDDLGYMYSGGHVALVDDMRMVSSMARELFPGKPFYLLGHSMGSLAARAYVHDDDSLLDGLIICGSPAYKPSAGTGAAFTAAASKLGLSHSRPRGLQNMVSSRYNRKFRSEGPQSWTCSDPEVRRSFQANPKNNFRLTMNGSNCLLNLMKRAYSRKDWAASCPDMPILFLYGDDDPCTGGAKGLDKAVSRLTGAGYHNISRKSYPAMRHEILNEIGKESVWEDIFEFVSE